jgi:hypothetical protein
VKQAAVVCNVVALVALCALAVAAWADVSQAFDSGYYHLPFAARLAGVVDEHEYVFNSANEARFSGFPLLGEWLQGSFWRLTGRPQGANFVALLSIPLFAAWVSHVAGKRGSYLPWGAGVIGALGIPLVMTHATSAYVDLPASIALAAAGLGAFLLPAAEFKSKRTLALLVGLLCLSTHMRLQHLPAALYVLCIVAYRSRSAWLLLALPLVFWVPLRNLAVHGNPVYPVELSIFGHTLPYYETRYSSSPTYLVSVPGPVRWLASLAELGLPPLDSPNRYSVDQYAPGDSPAARMGGTFAPGLFCTLLLGIVAKRRQPARLELAYFAGFSLLTSLMPQAHELRYTLYWQLVVSAGVWVVAAPRLLPWTLTVTVASFLCVLGITRGEWLLPSGSTFRELLLRHPNHARIEQTPDGEPICVNAVPRTWLYIARFHGRRYQVIEADDDGTCKPVAEPRGR